MGRLLLVDGNSIINRAYYAVIGRAPMTAPDGTPTGAVNGFFNSVLGVMKEYEPDHLCILHDGRISETSVEDAVDRIRSGSVS